MLRLMDICIFEMYEAVVTFFTGFFLFVVCFPMSLVGVVAVESSTTTTTTTQISYIGKQTKEGSQIAQDKGPMWTVVVTVINLRVYFKYWEFLD
jgi:hypothetical protein